MPLHELHWSPGFIEEVLGQPHSPYHNADDEVAMARATGVDMVWTAPLGFTALTSVQLHGEDVRRRVGHAVGLERAVLAGGLVERDIVQEPGDWARLDPGPRPARTGWSSRGASSSWPAGELAVVGGVRGPFSATWMLAGWST